jgi:hypothetical protein
MVFNLTSSALRRTNCLAGDQKIRALRILLLETCNRSWGGWGDWKEREKEEKQKLSPLQYRGVAVGTLENEMLLRETARRRL